MRELSSLPPHGLYDLEEAQKRYLDHLEREHAKRMKVWEYLASDEFRDKIANSLYKEVAKGDPPWLSDKEADGESDDEAIANFDKLFFEDMVEEAEDSTTVTGKHTGKPEDFQEQDGKHKE